MKRKLCIILICVMAVMSFAGCRSKKETNDRGRDYTAREDRSAIPEIDWEDKIYEETIFEETLIDKAMADAVKIKVRDVTEETVTVKITAPDVGAEIIEWYDSLPEAEFSESLMEEEIVRLIEAGEPQETEVVMQYVYDGGGNVIIDYPNSYYDAIYCGVAEFFDYVTDLLYVEVMEVGENEANN